MNSTKKVLVRAKHEILELRKRDERQSIRLRMFDDMMAVFYGGPPSHGMGHSPDVLNEIKDELTREDEVIEKEKGS